METHETPKRQTLAGDAAGVRCSIRAVRRPDEVVLVYEPEATLGERVLVFETRQAIVRVSSFPAEWRRLSDDDLLKLKALVD
jgi:hypothetical protein